MKKILKLLISTVLLKVFYDVFNENKFVKEQIDKLKEEVTNLEMSDICLLYTSPSPRDRQKSRMPSSA